MAGRLPAALLIAVMAVPPACGQEAAEPAQAIKPAPSELRTETAGGPRPAVPYDARLHSGLAASSTESPARRFENVFLISLPFTAIGSMALVTCAALAFQKDGFEFSAGYQIAGAGLALLGSGLIAWHDLRRQSKVQGSKFKVEGKTPEVPETDSTP